MAAGSTVAGGRVAVVWPTGELVVVTRRRRGGDAAGRVSRDAVEARLAALADAAGVADRRPHAEDLERAAVEARLAALEAAVSAMRRRRRDDGEGGGR